MSRSRRNLIVLALLVAVVIAGGSAAAIAVGFGGNESGGGDGEGGGEITEGGPLAGQAAGGATASGAPVALDKPYSWGESSIINETDEPVTIERLELLEVPEGLRVLGMYALPGEETGIGMAEGYDPESWPQIPGLVIPPGKTYEFIAGFQLDEPGRFLIPGVRIYYQAGGEHYAMNLNRSVRWCGPLEEYDRCPNMAKVRY